jgi:hypothetical protein
MATYRFVAYDIQTSLKKQFDDSDLRLNQIIYWIQVVANRLRVDQLSKTDSGLYTSTFSSVPVQMDSKGRKYIDLPGSIMDLTDERGIVYITYNHETGNCCSGPAFAYTQFSPTTPSKSRLLNWSTYLKPSTTNPYFYRIGDKIDGENVDRVYFLGLECINISDVEIGLKCSLDPSSVCELDEQIPVPDERIEELMKAVLELGRWVTLLPNERINQGSDNPELTSPPMAAPRPPLPPPVSEDDAY